MTMLSAAKQRAIEALCTQPSVRSAAAAAGINRATLKRWIDTDAAFRAALAAAETELTAESERRMLQLSAKADDVLAETLENGTTAEKLRAAIAVKQIAQGVREFSITATLTTILEREKQRTAQHDEQTTDDQGAFGVG